MRLESSWLPLKPAATSGVDRKAVSVAATMYRQSLGADRGNSGLRLVAITPRLDDVIDAACGVSRFRQQAADDAQPHIPDDVNLAEVRHPNEGSTVHEERHPHGPGRVFREAVTRSCPVSIF